MMLINLLIYQRQNVMLQAILIDGLQSKQHTHIELNHYQTALGSCAYRTGISYYLLVRNRTVGYVIIRFCLINHCDL